MRIFEAADLTVVDVENLRAHYVRTLQHWEIGCNRAMSNPMIFLEGDGKEGTQFLAGFFHSVLSSSV